MNEDIRFSMHYSALHMVSQDCAKLKQGARNSVFMWVIGTHVLQPSLSVPFLGTVARSRVGSRGANKCFDWLTGCQMWVLQVTL